MAGRLIIEVAQPALDSNSKLMNGSTLEFYDATTLLAKNVVSSAALTTSLGNVVTASNGFFPEIWAADGAAYRVVWKNASGSTLRTMDNMIAQIGAGGNVVTTGNIGAGTLSPSDKLTAFSSTANNLMLRLYQAGVYECWFGQKSGIGALIFGRDAGYTNEQMRLTNEGNFLIGTTSNGPSNSSSFVFSPSGRFALFNKPNLSPNGESYCDFNYNGSPVGAIRLSGTTGVTYATSSDYRLKTNVTPMAGGLARINALNPVDYVWKSDGSRGSGFLAHELQAVLPLAVTGEKDAVDKDGKPMLQGVDYSRVVPDLVAAVQELSAANQALVARLAARGL